MIVAKHGKCNMYKALTINFIKALLHLILWMMCVENDKGKHQ